MPQTKTQHATVLFSLLTVIFYIFTLQHCIDIEEMVTLKCDKDSETVAQNMIVKAGMNCGVYMLQPVYPSWGTSLIRSKKKWLKRPWHCSPRCQNTGNPAHQIPWVIYRTQGHAGKWWGQVQFKWHPLAHNTCLHQSFVAPHAETQRESLTCSGGRTVWRDRSCETVTPNVECTNHRGIPSSLLKVLSDALTQPPGRAFLGQGQPLHPWSRQTTVQCYCWGLCLRHHMLTYTPIIVCFFFLIMGRSTNPALYLLTGRCSISFTIWSENRAHSEVASGKIHQQGKQTDWWRLKYWQWKFHNSIYTVRWNFHELR